MNKELFLTLALFTLALSAIAQPKPVPHPLESPFGNEQERTEIILPQVYGMNFYKADLHIHTIFSDGDVTPDMRVLEAWYDGLDAIAITDHMEYRRIEQDMYKFMRNYIREDIREEGRAVNTNIMGKAPDDHGILIDFNVGYDLAVKKASDYGILVVRGAEITRKRYGDYNVLFTRDNNSIYDPDIVKALSNARSQGAFIVHNHPDYDENTHNYLTELSNGLYEKGFIDAVEVGNKTRIWWHLFTHAVSGEYSPMANSDVHDYIYWRYGRSRDFEIPRYRNMNLILAKDLTETDLHEALRKGNTIAYTNNNLIGKSELLKELFRESVEFKIQSTTATKHHVIVTNRSSLPYYFRIGTKEYILNAIGSLHLIIPKEESTIDVMVLNMWNGNDEHPSLFVELK